MKRIIASVAALGCTLSAVAQQPAEYEYVPMVREGVEWEFYWTENMTHNGIAKFYFNGEIEINGFTYKKCYRLETAAYGAESTLIGFMREENRKVYSIVITDGEPGEEYISYNFDYDNVGETGISYLYNAGNPIQTTVTSLDYINIGNDIRKTIGFDNLPPITEGIGYTGNQHGTIISPDPLLKSCLLCYWSELIAIKDTEYNLEWRSDNYDSLKELAGTGDVESGSDGLQVMQGDGWLRIKVDCNCYRRAELTNAKGTVVDTVTLQGESEAEFTTEWLPAGVYVVSLISDTGIRSAKVRIK